MRLTNLAIFALGCGSNRCLSNEYANRAGDLKRVQHVGGTLLYPRSHFVYKAASSNEELAPNDPGFGDGRLIWPQIDRQPDRANPAYAEWNRAITTRAAKLAVGIDSEDKNATFDTSVDASGTIDGSYSYIVKAANDRLLDISFIESGYGWGAAHPLTGQTSFLWWLDRNRELALSDVFLPQSDWRDELTALVLRSLRAQRDPTDTLGIA